MTQAQIPTELVQGPVHGLMAEFEDPHDLVVATQAAYDAGYRKMDAYSPMPVHGLSEALGLRRTRLPMLILAGGLTGGFGGFALQYYASVLNYPYIVGGRPFNSWPAFVPITFELTVLLSAFGAVFGMFALNGLPQPYHPVFNVERFALASQTAFFLCIEATDPKFDRAETRRFLEGLAPATIAEVEP